MKFVFLSVLMTLISITQVYCDENEPKEGTEFWTSRNQIQVPVDDWLSSNPFREILLRMTRKPRPHQFIGLMGKRSMANTQITRKRHKVNSFVGLMGKRSQKEPESYEWSTIQTYEKRR
ncbi:protachykinin-1 [Kryptolebias marmoratus]|uniref:Tachykinin precursor 1 n=1 Tax=Kryptolebias marmoratus TaxID=37003 RepID=A0A3Q3EFA0_KRYMA|nr:protachykinin-1 [Kryptolebias marmoratus]